MISGLPRLHLMTLAYRCIPSSTGKPLHGGVFAGQYTLVRGNASPSGLVGSSSYVVHRETGMAVGAARDDATALADARLTLTTHQPADIAAYIERYDAERRERRERPRLPSIAKRRRAIFDASGGECHYCGSVLTFDGAWHVEHRQPKSRGGSDASENLAAACGLCNLRKKDKTEAEFRAEFGLKEHA